VGGRKELEGGRLATRDRPRELKREGGGRLVSDVSGRPAVAREEGWREGSGVWDSGGRPGRAGGSSSSSTAGLPLDGEALNFNFRCRDLRYEELECGGGFCKTTFILTARHLFRPGGSIYRCI
jgi:hypothetical protein